MEIEISRKSHRTIGFVCGVLCLNAGVGLAQINPDPTLPLKATQKILRWFEPYKITKNEQYIFGPKEDASNKMIRMKFHPTAHFQRFGFVELSECVRVVHYDPKTGKNYGKRKDLCDSISKPGNYYSHWSLDQERQESNNKKLALPIVKLAASFLAGAKLAAVFMKMPGVSSVFLKLAPHSKSTLVLGGAVGATAYTANDSMLEKMYEVSEELDTDYWETKHEQLTLTDPKGIYNKNFYVHVENIHQAVSNLKQTVASLKWKRHPEICETCYVHCLESPRVGHKKERGFMMCEDDENTDVAISGSR